MPKRKGEGVEISLLQQAQEERKRLHEEIEQRVIERTRELTTVNEGLRQELAERKRAEEAL
jgi:C4-dicarboxylate-specific signal transduction histidine kinase